ncbi:U3 snoRNP protein [Exophiala xenobiotica]|uniref:U3 small nucleolar RNA-associated protein 22 n=1 Tax=Lithohypha guttulata TaxID=1690604 RepID=A0ABR0KKX4_9EURO|nr:U3 snoRNP protein [Lithohypha guttulata]KAK5325440.1 U3 snoRNP protein [Exophiala xenobiotica]
MSVTKGARLGSHPAKRRKLSHESLEVEEALDYRAESHRDSPEAEATGEDSSDDDVDVLEAPENPTRYGARTKSRTSDARSNAVTLPTGSSSATLTFQAQTLIAELKPDYASRIRKMRPTADKVIEIIKAIPELQSMSLTEAQAFSRETLGVAIPWLSAPPSDIKYKFSFSKPSSTTVQGALMHNLGPQTSSGMVIVPEMPASMFQDKDYLNFRALHKRAFYLACIASALRKELQDNFSIRYASADGNELMSAIRLVPKSGKKGLSESAFEISPSLPSSLGPVDKMTPAYNCIRKGDLTKEQDIGSSNGSAFYNSTLRSLAAVGSLQSLLKYAANKADHFRDACLLGAVWLQQRDFSSARADGGFGLDEWAVVCALLLESGGHQGRPLFSPRYSAIQLFKAMLQVLSSRDMYDPLVVRGAMKLSNSNRPVLYDAHTGVNLLYKMTPWSYARLKHHATNSLEAVNSKNLSGFEPTFISKTSDPTMQFDESYEIDFSRSSPSELDLVYDIIKKGLGDRVSLVDLRHVQDSSWNLSLSPPSVEVAKVTIGLLINPEAALRFVDHGPAVEEKQESKQFRDFWGDKAELRRFKNGRISESLAWSADTPVAQQIIQYLCAKYFKLSPSAIKRSAGLQRTQLQSSLSSEEAFQAVNTKFQSLSSTLHHLDGLPLLVRSVSAASEHLRSSSLTLPLEPGAGHPIDAIIQFDSSGRWPDDLQAIQYTKIAFLNQVADKLAHNDRTLQTRIGLENTSTSSLGTHNTSYLDIIYASPTSAIPPIIFRLRIYHERELHLLQQALAVKTTLSLPVRETYQSALHAQKQTAAAVAHTTAIRTLITSFPPLSTTIRLLKSFIASHNLTLHVPDPILEVLAAHVFLSPSPWSTPGTATTAFARCLHFLARWDWTIEPLVVDLSLSQDMNIEQRHELGTRFAAWRKMDPNMNTVSWFAGTNIDSTGVVWSQGVAGQDPKPPRVIAGRLTALARAAMELVKSKNDAESKIMTNGDWDSIFSSSLEDFDFVLHLRGRKKAKSKSGQYKNLEIAAGLDIDTTGIDTVASYVEDLQRCFGSTAIFFYCGRDGGSNAVGGLWRPHVRGKEARPWRLRLGYSTVPLPMPAGTEPNGNGEDDETAKKAMCRVNVDGMLAEIGLMGEGIVEKITTKGA